MIKASIIVPVYKCENFIQKCIDSVLTQSFKNFELILVLDGEDEPSGKICCKYAKADKRIKIISKKHEGVSVARNRGIDNAEGEWIFFLDSDDWIEENYIFKMVEMAENETTDIFICDYFAERNSSSKRESFFDFSERNFQNFEKGELVKSCLFSTLYTSSNASVNIGVPWAKVYKKVFLKKNNLNFVPGLKRMQDTIFNLYAFTLAEKIAYKNVPLYHYSKNESSATNAYQSDFSQTAVAVYQEITNYAMWTERRDMYDIAYTKMIPLILEVINLQFVPKESNLSIWQKIKQINQLLQTQPFLDSLKKYNKNYLSKNQKLAVFLLRYKITIVVYLYVKVKRYVRSRKQIKCNINVF